jgi:hypothetical protein
LDTLEKQRGRKMKKLSVAALALCLAALGVPVVTQGMTLQTVQNDTKPQPVNIKGTVRSDNAKITFVADEGGKTWDVINPETLKNHVDQHIQVNANVDSEKSQIRVISVIVL